MTYMDDLLSYYRSGREAAKRDRQDAWLEPSAEVAQTIAMMVTDPGGSWWAGYYAALVAM